jgi:hypothetical protein
MAFRRSPELSLLRAGRFRHARPPKPRASHIARLEARHRPPRERTIAGGLRLVGYLTATAVTARCRHCRCRDKLRTRSARASG